MSLMNYMRIKSSKNKKKNILAGVFKTTDAKPDDANNGAGLKKRPMHIKLLQKPKDQKGYKKPTEAGKEQRRGALLNKGKHLKPADFYTRDYTVVHKVVRIPPSTEKTLVIPPSYDGWSFLVDFYNPTFSPNITEEQFKSGIRMLDRYSFVVRVPDHINWLVGLIATQYHRVSDASFIRTINKTLGKAYCTKRNHEYKNMDKFQNSIMMAGLFIMVVGFGLGMYAVLKELSSSLYFFVAGGCFAFVLILSLGLFLSVFIFTQEDKLNEVEIYKRVQATIDSLNTTFKPLGYEWKTTSRFLWLEFYKPGLIQMMPVPPGDQSPLSQQATLLPNGQLQQGGFPVSNQLPNNIPQSQPHLGISPPAQAAAPSPFQPNPQALAPNRAVSGQLPTGLQPTAPQQTAAPGYQQTAQGYPPQTAQANAQQLPPPQQQSQQPSAGGLPGRKFGRT